MKYFYFCFIIKDIVLAFGRNGEDYQTVPLLETLDISYNQVTQLSDESFVSFFCFMRKVIVSRLFRFVALCNIHYTYKKKFSFI